MLIDDKTTIWRVASTRYCWRSREDTRNANFLAHRCRFQNKQNRAHSDFRFFSSFFYIHRSEIVGGSSFSLGETNRISRLARRKTIQSNLSNCAELASDKTTFSVCSSSNFYPSSNCLLAKVLQCRQNIIISRQVDRSSRWKQKESLRTCVISRVWWASALLHYHLLASDFRLNNEQETRNHHQH